MIDRWSQALIDELIARHPGVRDCASHDLLSMWTALAARIHQEGIVGLQGNLPANLAEQLVARWKKGEVLHGSNRAVDVVAANLRYQVKCVRRTNPGRSSVAILPESLDFHELVIVVFEYDLSLCAVLEISAAELIGHADELMTGASKRRITLTRKFCSHPAGKLVQLAELQEVYPYTSPIRWTPPRWLRATNAS